MVVSGRGFTEETYIHLLKFYFMGFLYNTWFVILGYKLESAGRC